MRILEAEVARPAQSGHQGGCLGNPGRSDGRRQRRLGLVQRMTADAAASAAQPAAAAGLDPLGTLPAMLMAASVTVPLPAWILPGRAVCPPLEPGPVDTVACRETPGASGEANEVGHGSGRRPWARLGCRVGWWSACGWGSGMPAPSGQIPPPWAWWENEAPATRAACSSFQAQPVRLSTSCRCGVGTRWAGRWNSAPDGLWGRTTVRT